MRVLVVDDSADVRARLVALAREAGCAEVDEAAAADDALAAARVRPPDVVVLDVHLPGKTGLSIVGALKALPSPPKVIVLTNHPTEAHRRQCLSHGADHFLDKANDFPRLIDLLAGPTPGAA